MAFGKDTRKLNGLQSTCKSCQAERARRWGAANPEKVKARNAAYRAANLEKLKAREAAYRAAHPEVGRRAAAKWNAANKDRLKSYGAAWYAANRERVKALADARRKSNPEAWRVKRHTRRARKNGGKLSPNIAAKLLMLQRGKCACCGNPLGDDYHLDHIIPLALGGLNADSNIQLLTAACNRKKSAKHPIDYMQEKGFLL